MSRLWVVLVMGLVLCTATIAEAQNKRAPAKNVILLPGVQITGHAAMAVEVARIPAVMARAEFKRPVLSKVEDAAYKEPF